MFQLLPLEARPEVKLFPPNELVVWFHVEPVREFVPFMMVVSPRRLTE